MPVMGLDDRVRKRIVDLLADRELSVLAVAQEAGIPESTIRNFLNDKDGRSMQLRTLERVAEGFGLSVPELLDMHQEPINSSLLSRLLGKLLTETGQDQRYARSLVRSVLRVYEAGRRSGIDPLNPREIDLLTQTEADRLLSEATATKA